MLNAREIFNAILMLPPEKRNAIWNILQCGDDPLAPDPECDHDPVHVGFYCYALEDVEYHYDYDTTLDCYLELLDGDIRGWDDESMPEPWLVKERLIADFHGVQQDMLRLGWDGDYSQEPTVFHIPCLNGNPFEVGFIWKQHRNGLTFIASPFPLTWLGGARIERGDKR